MTEASRIIEVARSLVFAVQEILPPLTVLERCRAHSARDSRLQREVIGRTQLGHDIEAYRFGAGKFPVLLYAFPDPGEAVGGTATLSLVEGLLDGDTFLASLDVAWHFIPCLNLDDQPNEGRALGTVFRDPTVREVDWCADNPRTETAALLEYAEAIRPAFTYPLHDEFHCGKSVPVYFFGSGALPMGLRRDLVSAVIAFGLTMKEDNQDGDADTAFLNMTSCRDFPKSTFARFSRHGMVLCGEVSRQAGVSFANLAGAQLAVGLIALQCVLQANDRSIEQSAAIVFQIINFKNQLRFAQYLKG